MARTITTSSGPVSLTSANPGDSPLYILTGVTVTGGTIGVYGDASHTWTVTNQGTASGGSGKVGFGIEFKGGGAFTNSGTASHIDGGYSGFSAYANAATVTNQGAIVGSSNNAVYFQNGGTLTNSGTAATVAGGTFGFFSKGGIVALSNDGMISAKGNIAVYIGQGGAVTNNGTAANIAGGNLGVEIVLAGGTVTNQGTITATNNSGVRLVGGGTVANSGAAALISGGKIGVYAGGTLASIVINDGAISGGSTGGVALHAGGTVTNSAGARISGGIYGVKALTGAGSVVNDGTISGTSNIGVVFTTGGTLSNASAGFISGGKAGVYAGGTVISSFTNDGIIFGSSGAGLIIQAGGSVINNAAATISGGVYGVTAGTGAVASVINHGTIYGTGNIGVTLGAGGIVTNSAAARISGGKAGVYANGSVASSVFNAGTLSGGSGTVGFGMEFKSGGTLTNSGTAAIIAGGYSALAVLGGAGTVANQGAFIGSSHSGIYFQHGGKLSNSGTAASIFGGVYGVFASNNPTTITNDGTIDGKINIGVYLGSGGVITNTGTATGIFGGHAGVLIGGSGDTVINQGTITGTIDTGVKIIAAGTVTNSGTAARIAGGKYGIDAKNGAVTVINQGTISGAAAAVRFANFDGNLFRLFPGAVTTGSVQGGSGVDTLALGSVFTTGTIVGPDGTIAGIGSQFTGFDILSLDSRAVWQMNGANTLATSAIINLNAIARLVVSGQLGAPTNLTLTGSGTLATTGTGAIEIGTAGSPAAGGITVDAGHSLVISGNVSVGQVVNQGSISGSVDALYLGAGGTVTNSGTAASITGVAAGIAANYGKATITNQGIISGSKGGTSGEGVYLVTGGSVSNSGTAASIYGGRDGVFAAYSSRATVFNQGTITGKSMDGVHLTDGGLLTNSGFGSTIAGYRSGAYLGPAGGADTIVNVGMIFGTGTASTGVYLGAGGTITNSGTRAVISGGKYGVGANNLVITLVNQGAITGTSTDGVYLGAGGVVTNAAAAHISGGILGVSVKHGTATINNSGTISGTGTASGGVYLGAGGTLSNGTAALIAGAYSGVSANGNTAVITNQGTISSTASTGIYLGAGGAVTNSGKAAHIAAENYAIFAIGSAAGTVANQGTISSAAKGGVYLGAGGTLTNSGSAADIAGATWGIYVAAAAATVTNQGTIAGTIGAVQFASVSGNLFRLYPGAVTTGTVMGGLNTDTLALGSAAAHGTISGIGSQFLGFETVDFDPGATWLAVGNTAGLASGQNIAGFTLGDTIELTGFVETSHTVTAGGLVLGSSGGPQTIAIEGTFGPSAFNVTNDGINSFVQLACFASGTRIATRHGNIAVEALRVGDTVQVLGDKPASIVWIGHRTVDCARHPNPAQVWPVRISVDAFGPGCPHRDLYLSPDHAVFVADVLIPVKYLVNGTSIEQLPVDRTTYYHLELAAHDVVLAEGLPVESYLDTGDRMSFANGGGAITLHPDFSVRTWESQGYAPLVVSGPQLDAVRRRLNAMPRHNRLRATASVRPRRGAAESKSRAK